MPRVERMRDFLSGPLTAADIEKRAKEGWKPVAVVWERRWKAAPSPRTSQNRFRMA